MIFGKTASKKLFYKLFYGTTVNDNYKIILKTSFFLIYFPSKVGFIIIY